MLVAHPLDDGTAHKDTALQSILHLAVQADADGGDQAVLAAADASSPVFISKKQPVP